MEHLLERAAIMATSPEVSLVEPLGGAAPAAAPQAVAAAAPGAALPAQAKSYEQAERDNIIAALTQSNYRIRGKGGAAELLDIKPTTLESKLARMGISRR
jgi:transcriptional regulator with GAF, ATPase, and Fis domain